MTKTLEQMAEAYSKGRWATDEEVEIERQAILDEEVEIERQAILCVSLLAINDGEYFAAKKAYKAGYQAAKDQQADADKVKFCVYCNDTHKGNCAIGKGKNHPAFGFSEIVVRIESSWISVKDRLPEEGQDCIFYVDFIDKWDKGSERINFQEIGVFNGKDRFYHRSHTDLDRVTYWMPLPKPPEDK